MRVSEPGYLSVHDGRPHTPDEVKVRDHPYAWQSDNEIPRKGLAPAHNRPTVFLDTEFTGFPVSKALPVDVCALKVGKSGIAEVYDTKILLDERARSGFNPIWEQIVGYDPEEWRESAQLLEKVARELFIFIQGAALVCHGPADVQLWSRIWSGLGIHMSPTTCFPMSCTNMLARHIWPGLKSYTVSALCEHLGLEPEQEHRARGGAERCRAIYQRLRK